MQRVVRDDPSDDKFADVIDALRSCCQERAGNTGLTLVVELWDGRIERVVPVQVYCREMPGETRRWILMGLIGAADAEALWTVYCADIRRINRE